METNRRNQADVILHDSDRRDELNLNNVPAGGIYVAGPVNLRGVIRSDTRYPCLNPQNPHMRFEEVRFRSFFSHGVSLWQENTFATERQMARTGLYYIGERDKVKCFYCNGGLENWEQYDDPWTEHAKWYPHCEFLLQQRGDEFVRSVRQRQQYQQHQQQQEQERLEQQRRLELQWQQEQQQRERHQQERQQYERQQQERQQYERQQQERQQQASLRNQQELTRLQQLLQQQPQQQQPQQQQQQSQPPPPQSRPSTQPQTNQQRSTNQQQPTRQQFSTTSRSGRHSTYNIYINNPGTTRTTTTTTTRAGNNIPRPGTGTATTIIGGTPRTGGGTGSSTGLRPGTGPEIIDAGEERRTIEEIVGSAVEGSPLAARARVMGFTNEQIRVAMFRQITDNIFNFETAEELVNAIVNSEPQRPTTSSPTGGAPVSEIDRIRSERLCKICRQHDACIVFIPCGHLVSCTACSATTRRCPIADCTSPNIEERIRSYIS